MKNKLFVIGSLLSGLMLVWGCESPDSTKTSSLMAVETKMDSAVLTVVEEDSQTSGKMIKCSDSDTVQEKDDRVEVPGVYDFNGDGEKESCYLLEPQKNEESPTGCDGDCVCLIQFSDENIPPIEVQSCISGMPHVLGDLDGNGTVEIGIWPLWWTSCWHSYSIYTLVNGKWTFFVEPFTVHCNLIEELEGPIIEADKGNNDMYWIKFSDFDDADGIVTKTKKVKKLI